MIGQPRGRLQGTCEIIQYNLHQYLGALGFLVLAVAALLFLQLSSILLWVLLFAIAIVGYWSIASIIVSYFVYDASRIYDPVWMRTLIDDRPAKWANMHAGVDDFSGPLSSAYGQPLYNWDIFDDGIMTEPSIQRARSIRGNAPAAPVDFRELPCSVGELDAIFAFFVLHEIRDASLRRKCFDEIARCTAPSGKLVIVEHLRDFPNFIAFGPGFLHFWPRSEWLQSASLAGFELLNETSMTPFVRVMVFKRP